MSKQAVITALHYYPHQPSGSSKLAYDHAIGLVKRGWHVWLVAQDLKNNQPEYMQADGLHILQYQTPRLESFDPRRIGIHQSLVRDLLRRYVTPPVDLLHGHTLLLQDGVLTHFADVVQTAYSIHSPVKLEMLAGARGEPLTKRFKQAVSAYLLHRVERRVLERSHILTSDSRYTRMMVGQLHNQTIADRVSVVPGWVDLDHFRIAADRQAVKKVLGWPLDVPVLFTLRRLVPRNGLDRLLAALALVRSAGHTFQMIIGGNGPLRERLEELASRLNINDCVRFVGFVADDLLPQMYAAADLFVLPTNDLECFGLITLEAFASGCPVVATPVGAIPEIVRAVEPAWLTDDATPEAIAGHIIDFLEGRLPKHPPGMLRDFASRYARDPLVARLIQMTVGPDGE